MKGIVYILQNESGKYYIGSTNDLSRRLRQHHSGSTHSTKRMGSLSLVYKEEFDSLAVARRIESHLRRLKRKDYIANYLRQED